MTVFPEAKKPFPQINPIWNIVRSELNRRRFTVPTPTMTPFVRFTSPKSDDRYQNFHIGLHTDSGADAPTYELSYGASDVVGYAYQGAARVPITSNDSTQTAGRPNVEGKHPMPGVSSVRIEHIGVMEPIRVRVDWKCYNTTQLEFLRHHFGIAGSYVVLEIGQADSSGVSNAGPKFNWKGNSQLELANSIRRGRSFIMQEYTLPNRGNYDLFVGQITDYGISILPDGSYECYTEFYSIGEAMYGINNHALLKYRNETDSPDASYTINDYFRPTKEFDLLTKAAEGGTSPQVINLKVSKLSKRTKNVEFSSDEEVEEQQRAKLERQWSEGQGIFVSWNFFLTEVIPDILKTINLTGGSGGDAVNQQINLLKQINFGGGDAEEPLVGDHPKLASTDLFTMVIVKPEYINNDSNTGNKPVFDIPTIRGDRQSVTFGNDQIGGTSGGHLSSGIWINKDAIIESFLNTNNFYSAINQLLVRMSNATANYWRLSLVFDENDGLYKIYDKNMVTDQMDDIGKNTYVFNKGSYGELLSLEFDATFANEMKTAILLSSRVRPGESLQQLGKKSLIPGPQIHAQVLNQTPLKDLVETALQTFTPSLGGPGRGEVQANRAAAKHDEKSRIEALRDNKGASPEIAMFDQSISHYWKYESELLYEIRKDGLENPARPNSFIAPVPTEINLSMTVRGISGIQFFDYFHVDKLPKIYGQLGVFIVNALSHEVTEMGGWKTTIGGLYYMCWPLGNNPSAPGDHSDAADEKAHAVLSRPSIDDL